MPRVARVAKVARSERDNEVGNREFRQVTEQQRINEGKDVNVRIWNRAETDARNASGVCNQQCLVWNDSG